MQVGYVYIVSFADGSFYIGCCKDVFTRFKYHSSDSQSAIYKKLKSMGVKDKLSYMKDNHVVKYKGDDYIRVEKIIINENRCNGMMLNKLLPALNIESFLIELDRHDVFELDRQAAGENRTRSAHIRELIKKGKLTNKQGE